MIDRFAVSYNSSIYMLEQSIVRQRQRTTDTALVAGVTTYQTLTSLSNAEFEADLIAQILDTDPLPPDQITKKIVLRQASAAAYIHLICHGSFAWWDDPMASALRLHEDEVLSLNDIVTSLKLEQAPLVVLSACETGISDVRNIPEEFIGLPTGFIEAGAASVMSSLWAVSDATTPILMERFYQNLLRKEAPMEPAHALQEAQMWLRDNSQEVMETLRLRFSGPGGSVASNTFQSKQYASPFYWAPFVLYGV